MPVLSIILPVYNVEMYLEKCMESLVCQHLKDVEIIAINDGSTDSSANILKSYQPRLPMMRVIHQENKGLAEARNTAIALATGKYIFCVDSDDYLPQGAISTIMHQLDKHQLDVFFFSTHIEPALNIRNFETVKKYYQRPETLLDENMNAETFFNRSIEARVETGSGYSVVVWGYAYRREMFAHMRFQTACFEDEYFTTELLLSVPHARVRCTGERLYHHVLRNGSITTSNNRHRRALAILETLRLLALRTGEIESTATLKSLHHYFYMLYRDAIYRNLAVTEPVFSAKKMVIYLSTALHQLYTGTATENGLIFLLLVIERIAEDAGIAEDEEVKAIKERFEMAIDTKRSILASL